MNNYSQSIPEPYPMVSNPPLRKRLVTKWGRIIKNFLSLMLFLSVNEFFHILTRQFSAWCGSRGRDKVRIGDICCKCYVGKWSDSTFYNNWVNILQSCECDHLNFRRY